MNGRWSTSSKRCTPRSNTAGIAAQPSFCFPVIARLGAILSTALERPGVEIGVRLGQKGLKPIMSPEASEEQPDLRCLWVSGSEV